LYAWLRLEAGWLRANSRMLGRAMGVFRLAGASGCGAFALVVRLVSRLNFSFAFGKEDNRGARTVGVRIAFSLKFFAVRGADLLAASVFARMCAYGTRVTAPPG